MRRRGEAARGTGRGGRQRGRGDGDGDEAGFISAPASPPPLHSSPSSSPACARPCVRTRRHWTECARPTRGRRTAEAETREGGRAASAPSNSSGGGTGEGRRRVEGKAEEEGRQADDEGQQRQREEGRRGRPFPVRVLQAQELLQAGADVVSTAVLSLPAPVFCQGLLRPTGQAEDLRRPAGEGGGGQRRQRGGPGRPVRPVPVVALPEEEGVREAAEQQPPAQGGLSSPVLRPQAELAGEAAEEGAPLGQKDRRRDRGGRHRQPPLSRGERAGQQPMEGGSSSRGRRGGRRQPGEEHGQRGQRPRPRRRSSRPLLRPGRGHTSHLLSLLHGQWGLSVRCVSGLWCSRWYGDECVGHPSAGRAGDTQLYGEGEVVGVLRCVGMDGADVGSGNSRSAADDRSSAQPERGRRSERKGSGGGARRRSPHTRGKQRRRPSAEAGEQRRPSQGRSRSLAEGRSCGRCPPLRRRWSRWKAAAESSVAAAPRGSRRPPSAAPPPPTAEVDVASAGRHCGGQRTRKGRGRTGRTPTRPRPWAPPRPSDWGAEGSGGEEGRH